MYQELFVICTILTSERLPYILTPLLPGPSLNIFGPNVTWKCFKKSSQDFNLFVRNIKFLYRQKTSENCEVFLCFQGLQK